MHTIGYYKGAQRTLEGELNILLSIKDESQIEALQKLTEHPVVIDIKKFREKRSDDANRYFWQLADRMGKSIGITKWDVYLMEISRWGVFIDIIIPADSVDILRREYRLVEIFDDCYEQSNFVTARCYIGSSKYNSKEMSDFINGAVQDAKDLGIETMTQEEIKALISAWEPWKPKSKENIA